jgi:hypothetical protein
MNFADDAPVEAPRRCFVVHVRDGDEAGIEAAEARLRSERGMTDADSLVFIRQFGDAVEAAGDLEYPMLG